MPSWCKLYAVTLILSSCMTRGIEINFKKVQMYMYIQKKTNSFLLCSFRMSYMRIRGRSAISSVFFPESTEMAELLRLLYAYAVSK